MREGVDIAEKERMIEEQPRQQAQDQTGQRKAGWLKNRNIDREKIKYAQRTHSMKVKRVVVGSMSMVRGSRRS